MSTLNDVMNKVKKVDVDKALNKSYEIVSAAEALNSLNGGKSRDKIQKSLGVASKVLGVLSMLKSVLGK